MDYNFKEIVRYLKEQYSTDTFIHEGYKGVSNWLKDSRNIPDTINPEQIEIRFKSQFLCFENKFLNEPYISTHYDLYVNDLEIGYYKLISKINGEPEDDYFVI